MIAAILAATAVQALPPTYHPLLTFSAHPELQRVTTRVEVGLLAGTDGARHYWFRKTVVPDRGKIVETAWTDTRACPGSRSLLEELGTLEGPRPYVSGLDGSDAIRLTADGVTYQLDATESAEPYSGRLQLKTNTGTPLAHWVDAALARLAGCWRKDAPA